MQEYSSAKSDMKELYQFKKNYEKYMSKEIERQLSHLIIFSTITLDITLILGITFS